MESRRFGHGGANKRRAAVAGAAVAMAVGLAPVVSMPAVASDTVVAGSAAREAALPGTPRIVSNGPYTECGDVCVGGGGPGVPGSFTFSPDPEDTREVTGYRWRLPGSGRAQEAEGREPTLDIVPRYSGTQVLTVEPRYASGGYGPPAEFVFKVAPPSGPVGHWHFDEGAPGSGELTAHDSASTGSGLDVTLSGAGADWSEQARRDAADRSLSLDNPSPDHPGGTEGHAATAAPVVDTARSFTVSAWAYLADASGDRVVLSQPGTHDSAFRLSYSSTARTWAFERADGDRAGAVPLRSVADAADPPLHVWTHVAGVFDTKGDADWTNDTVQLFVNGRPQGAPVAASAVSSGYEPWAATGGLQVGRAMTGGGYGGFFHGRVDEVTAWQRALGEGELREDARAYTGDGLPGTELVASWDARSATGAGIPEATSYPWGPMALSGTGAVLDANDRSLTLDGSTGYASSEGPVVDETGSFTVTVKARLDSAKLAGKPAGYRTQVFGQRGPGGASSWGLWFTKFLEEDGRTVGLWSFERTAADSEGDVASTARVESDEIAELDTWVQLTGFFDASEEWVDGAGATRYGRIGLYVGGAGQGDGNASGLTAPRQGAGELSLGRGIAGGSYGGHLPGAVQEARVWAGAMTANQVNREILEPNG